MAMFLKKMLVNTYLAGLMTNFPRPANPIPRLIFEALIIGCDIVDISKFRNALEKHNADEISSANKEAVKYNN
jgi:hypothetical protein